MCQEHVKNMSRTCVKNSRIDRVYVNSINMTSITNMNYIQTPFQHHKIFAFNVKNENDWGKSYYKLNTSLFEDEAEKKNTYVSAVPPGWNYFSAHPGAWKIHYSIFSSHSPIPVLFLMLFIGQRNCDRYISGKGNSESPSPFNICCKF